MKQIISAFLVAIGLTILGVFLYCGLDNIAQREGSVYVRGLAEREVKANKVTWPIVFKVSGNDLQGVYRDATKLNKVVTDFLTSNGIAENEINMAAPSVWNKNAQTYNTSANYSYMLTQVITVASENVENVSDLVLRQGELLALGVPLSTDDYGYSIDYEYSLLNEIKPEMIAEATANARSAANKFADDSQSKIGHIIKAEQGQFSITDRDAFTPWIKNVRVVTYVTFALKD